MHERLRKTVSGRYHKIRCAKRALNFFGFEEPIYYSLGFCIFQTSDSRTDSTLAFESVARIGRVKDPPLWIKNRFRDPMA